MKRFPRHLVAFFILPLLLLACDKDGVQPDALPANLDLSELEVQFKLDYNYDFGYDSPTKLAELTSMLVAEMYEEDDNTVNWVEITVTSSSTTLLFDDGKKPGFEKKGGCSEEGWDRVGEGRCYSERCVRDRVATAFETTPEQGECLDVRIDRGGIGVRVCSRLSEC